MPLSYAPFVASDRIHKAAANAPWMSKGETSSGVAILQGALADLGYKLPITFKKTGFPDGIYGAETKSVVYQFQSDQKLAGKDGAAGAETIARLDSLLAARKKPRPFIRIRPLIPKVPKLPPAHTLDERYKIGSSDPSIPRDAGAGVYDSEAMELSMFALAQVITEALPPFGSSAVTFYGVNCAMHLRHYMSASGRPLTIDLEDMVDSGPTPRERFRDEVAQAKAFVEKLGVGTHSITSRKTEDSYNFESESKDWFYAVGGYHTWGKGTATVAAGVDGLEYALDFEYRFFDLYNWDGGKSVPLAGVTITDEFMGTFHRQGLAREFDMRGSIKRTFRWRQGEAIPEEQYELSE